jgi:chorismate mutase
MSDYAVTASPIANTQDPIAADALDRPSIAELHRRCLALENERRSLAVAIGECRIGGLPEYRRLSEREARVIRQIGEILDLMQSVPVRNIDDIAALLDLALDIELDPPPPDLIVRDRPWTLRLVRALRSLAPSVEMSWLRRLSPPGFDLEAEIFTAEGEANQASARDLPQV